MTARRVKVLVYGVVQGVGFRYSTQREADRLGLVGHASNLSDGSVEVVAQGESAAIDKLLAWLRIGPRFAEVDKLQISELDPEVRSESDFRAY